jgi:hypothetical protein
MSAQGFTMAKRRVIAALLSGQFQHEASRSDVAVKNLLLTGVVSAAEVCALIRRARGQDHRASAHHQVPGVVVHVIRREGWYVKFYFLDPDVIFISVHR